VLNGAIKTHAEFWWGKRTWKTVTLKIEEMGGQH